MSGLIGLFGLIGLLGTAGFLLARGKGQETGDPLANYPIARQPCLPNADVAHTPLMNPVITPEAAGLTRPPVWAPRPPEPRKQHVPSRRARTESGTPAGAPAKAGTFEGRLRQDDASTGSLTSPSVAEDRVAEDPVGEPETAQQHEEVPLRPSSASAPAPLATKGFLGGLITKASHLPQAAARLPRKLRRR